MYISNIYPMFFDTLSTSQTAEKGVDSIAILFFNHDKYYFFSKNIIIPLSYYFNTFFLCY